MNLLETLRAQFAPVLAKCVPDASKLDDFLQLIKPAQNLEHGDYQANFAMPMGKILGRKPQEVAREIIDALPENDVIESASVAGPGFINIRIAPAFLAKLMQQMGADPRLGIEPIARPRTYVIDYSGPNVAKPLHVGHLRSTIIGESLCRILRFLGHKVIGDNHLGDWGTQFGMLLYGYKHFLDAAAFEADPVQELARLYRYVRELAKANDDDEGDVTNPIADAYRQETVKLHAGDPENVALWKKFMPACMEEVEAIYRRLDVHFDHQYGESFYNPMLPAVVEDLLSKNLAVESEGAVIIPNYNGKIPRTEEEKQKEPPPSLIRKRDGAYTYTTTDLATIKYRIDTWQPDAILYVVDFRQASHFKNLFAAAIRWGFGSVEMTHVSFGSVLGEDRKPMQTRKGGNISLESLLDQAVARGAELYKQTRQERLERGEEVPELSEEQIQAIAEAVGIGAVKYADLSQNRTSDYVFSYDKMLATDGNTATYMQYAYVRNRGIFRKGEIHVEQLRNSRPEVLLETSYERALALQLARFHEILQASAQEYLPHYLTGYLWELSKTYSGFFVNCPVLKAESPALRTSRLLLCDLTARVIHQTLQLLGIQTVEQM